MKNGAPRSSEADTPDSLAQTELDEAIAVSDRSERASEHVVAGQVVFKLWLHVLEARHQGEKKDGGAECEENSRKHRRASQERVGSAADLL